MLMLQIDRCITSGHGLTPNLACLTMMTIIVNTYNRYQEEVRGGHSVEVAGILLNKSLCVQHTHHKCTGTDLCPPKMDIFILISILPQTNIVSHETPSLLSKLYS